MKIGVVGTFIRDRISPWQGETVESIGGIFFTVSYLANLLDCNSEIYPVAYVGDDFYDQLIEQLSAYENVRLEGIRRVARTNTRVELFYSGPQERYEVTTPPMPPLTLDELAILRDTDAVLVNLITGADVDLQAVKQFGAISTSLIYLDFHSHALGTSQEGRRYYRRPTDWRDWIESVDVLQLNEMEARTLAGYSSDQPKEILVEFGKKVLEMRPQVCHLTLGENGSYLVYQDGKRVHVKRFKALRVSNVVDIIGCGDAFAAGYLAHYFLNQDVPAATDFAIEVSGLNCTFIGSSGVKEIHRLLQKRLVAEGEFVSLRNA